MARTSQPGRSAKLLMWASCPIIPAPTNPSPINGTAPRNCYERRPCDAHRDGGVLKAQKCRLAICSAFMREWRIYRARRCIIDRCATSNVPKFSDGGNLALAITTDGYSVEEADKTYKRLPQRAKA